MKICFEPIVLNYFILISRSDSIQARYFAALVPLANSVRLVIHGLCLVKDDGLIKSVTREGKPE